MKKPLLCLSALALLATFLSANHAEAKTNWNVDIYLNPVQAPPPPVIVYNNDPEEDEDYYEPSYPGYGHGHGNGYGNPNYGNPGYGRPPRWDQYDAYDSYRRNYLGSQVLGTTRLSYGRDLDIVPVDSCMSGMAVDSVKVKVERNDAYIDFISITLANGRELRLPVRNNFMAGESSRWFRLNGLRCIESFTVMGSTDGLRSKKSKIKLIGNAYSVH